jgi:triacylglycerol esterase/lipase EstA (alpha/beta hydrolase family)
MGRFQSTRARTLILAAAAALGLFAATPLGTAGAAAPADTAATAALSDTAAALPAGINDFSCRPDGLHPYPVVLVHGTFSSAAGSWQTLGPAIKAAGYCVFALDYGNHGTGLIEQSARELAAFVARVLSATHARKVEFVGHSQGGMMPRYYIRFLGGAATTAGLIGLAPSNHGTANPLTPIVGLFCPACDEQFVGSPFLTALNAGHDVEPGVRYTVVATIFDLIVVPYWSQFLAGPASQVTNVTLQRRCPFDLDGHTDVTSDPVVRQWVLNALAGGGLADPGFRPDC